MSGSSRKIRISSGWRCLFLMGVALALSGCATSRPAAAGSRHFNFAQDTFAYANDLVWEYHFDERGKWVHQPREPKPDYTHHCFVVARAAKQFFAHARFDASQPISDENTYRRLIDRVVSRSPRRETPDERRVVIPGYANLREFSAAWTKLLQAECGGAWQSYFQRGHWRMIWPFSRCHQRKTARELLAGVKQNHPAVVHVVCFPSLRINHAVLLFDAAETETEIRFTAYDPNSPAKPVILAFDRATRSFSFPTNFYFPGGRVNVYRIYYNWRY
jgi:hypothetical protein